MANLLEIAELVWRRVHPNPSDEVSNEKDEFIAVAKSEYAYQVWRKAKEEKREEGMFDIPSYLLSRDEIIVANNVADISHLEPLKSLEDWVQNIGGLVCDCKYVKSTINMTQLMCDDDSIGNDKTFIIIDKAIEFPKGTHADKLPIIYANNGKALNAKEIEIDDALGAIIRKELLQFYGQKVEEDVTNNTNSNG